MTKIIFLVIALIAIGALISWTGKTKKSVPKRSQQLTEKPDHQNIYMEMRERAFSAKADELGLGEIPENKVYGLITEMGMNPGSASVIAFLSGDTSLYLSSGGGFIGAGQHEDVREIVIQKVDGFQKYLLKAQKIEVPKLPEKGKVNFNFLTKNGLYSVSENMADLESGQSELSGLFGEVNEIITQIRLKSND